MSVDQGTRKPCAIESSMRKIKELNSYPLQAIHPPLPPAEEQAFLEDIRANGITDPISIMPADNAADIAGNTILDGHRRVEAARTLKILNIAVRVRHDSAALSRAQLDAVFLRLSTDRRNLAQVEVAYLLFKLYVTEKGGTQSNFDDAGAKKFVAERMELDVRTVSRYARLFRTPSAIRTAVARGVLSLVMGEKVSDLTAAAQEKLAVKMAACQDGRTIANLVRQALPKKATTPHRATQVAARRLTNFLAGLRDLADNAPQVEVASLARHLHDLQEGAAQLAALIRRAHGDDDIDDAASTDNPEVDAADEDAWTTGANDDRFDDDFSNG